MLNAREWKILLVFAAVAALLRFWSIGFGLSIEKARPDEEFVAGIALRMVQTGDWNPHFFHYPTLLIYLNGFLLSILSPLRDPESARLVSRMVSASTGVASVLLLAPLGARLFSPRVGLLASFWLAAAYLHVRESHFGTTGVPMTLLVTLSVLLAVRAEAEGRVRDLRLSALAAGLAASVKYPGILALVPLGLVFTRFSSWSRSRRLLEVGIAAVIAVSAIVLTSPYVVLDASGARLSVSEMGTELWGTAAPQGADPWFPISFSLWHGIGAALLSLGLAGLVVTARERPGQTLLSWTLPFYIAAAATPFLFARYALPFLPPLLLTGAAFLDRLPLGRAARLVLAFLVALVPLGRSIAFVRLLGGEDTRELARKWVREHVPAEEGVLVMRGYGAPPIDETHRTRSVAFRLGGVSEGEREGFHYLVTHEHPGLTRFSRLDGSLRRRLDRAELLAEFDPFRPGRSPGIYDPYDAFYLPYADFDGVTRPGPRVAIWKLTPRRSE